MQIEMTTVKGRKKVVGEIIDAVFYKDIEYSKHLFRKAQALGIDKAVLPVLKDNGVTQIILRDLESGKKFAISLANFEAKKWLHATTGFQSQFFVPLSYWTITDRFGVIEQRGKEVKVAPVKPEPQGVQQTLL